MMHVIHHIANFSHSSCIVVKLRDIRIDPVVEPENMPWRNVKNNNSCGANVKSGINLQPPIKFFFLGGIPPSPILVLSIHGEGIYFNPLPIFGLLKRMNGLDRANGAHI